MAEHSAQQHRAMVIAATFTAEPLSPSLSFVLDQAGTPHAISFSPYNQVFQELLSDTSALAKNGNGINVILLRVEDFVRDIEDTSAARPLISRTVHELASALGSYARRTKNSNSAGRVACLARREPISANRSERGASRTSLHRRIIARHHAPVVG